MKILDILSKVGTAVISTLVPGSGVLISAVNELLPDGKKLPTDVTGAQMQTAISGLAPADQAVILGREFDVEVTQIKESNETLRTMLATEQASPHTTRPKIALRAFYQVAFTTSMVVLMWAYAVVTHDAAMVAVIMDGWPWVAALLVPYIGWLNAYFGILKQEQRDRLNAANGSVSGGVVSSLLGKITGKK